MQDDRSVKSNLSKQAIDVAFHFDQDITYSSLPPARVDNQDPDDDYAARRRAQKCKIASPSIRKITAMSVERLQKINGELIKQL